MCFQLLSISGFLPEPAWGAAQPRTSGQLTQGHGERMCERRGQVWATGARVPLLPWDYISLALGWARCFLKMTNQLSKLLHTSGWYTSQPITSFPRLDLQASLAQHVFRTILTCTADVPAFPWPHPESVSEGGRRALFSMQLSC